MLEWSTKIELHVVAERIKRIRESDDLSLEWILECNGIILPLSSVLPSSAATTPQRKQLRLEIDEQAAYSRLVGVRFAPKSEEKSDENLISFRDWYRSHRASHQPVAESDIIELGASGTWDGWSVRPADVPSRVVFGFQMLVHQVDRAKDGWYYEADSSLESLLDQCMEAKDPVAHIVHWDLNRFSNLNDFALHCLGHAADEGSPAANYIRWTCKPTPESEYETESEYSYESEPELVDRIESKTQAANGSSNQTVSQTASGCPYQVLSQNEDTPTGIIESSHSEIQTTANSDQKCDSQSSDPSVESREMSNSQSSRPTLESDKMPNSQSPSLTADKTLDNTTQSDTESDTELDTESDTEPYTESDNQSEKTSNKTILSDTIPSEQASDNIKSSQPNEHSQLPD
eukprot:500632_1